MNNNYETTIIFDSSLDDNGIQGEVGRLSQVIEAHGGQILRQFNAGRRKLAYKIKHKEFGVYVLLVHDGDNSLVAALERQLQISESVLRHLCVKKDKFAPDGDLLPLDDQHVGTFDDEESGTSEAGGGSDDAGADA